LTNIDVDAAHPYLDDMAKCHFRLELLSKGAEFAREAQLFLSEVEAYCHKEKDSRCTSWRVTMFRKRLKLYIDNGGELNATNGDGQTAAFLAASLRAPVILQMLTAYPATNVNIVTNTGSTALLETLQVARSCTPALVDVVRILLAAGALPNVRELHGRGLTPLHFALRLSSAALVRDLCEAGANVDVHFHTESEGRALPLIAEAAQAGTPEIVEILLRHGADPNAQDAEGNSPLLRCLLHGTPRRWPDVDTVKMLLLYNANAQHRNMHGRSAMDCIVRRFRELSQRRMPSKEETRLLLGALMQAGYDINAQGETEHIPICSAISHRLPALAWALLASGARPSPPKGIVQPLPRHPLALAVHTGQPEIVEDLARHGASFLEMCSEGRTVLQKAVGRRQDKIVMIYLNQGATPSVPLSNDRDRAYFQRLLENQPIFKWKLGLEGLPQTYWKTLRPWVLLKLARACRADATAPCTTGAEELYTLIDMFMDLPRDLSSYLLGFLIGQDFRFGGCQGPVKELPDAPRCSHDQIAEMEI